MIKLEQDTARSCLDCKFIGHGCTKNSWCQYWHASIFDLRYKAGVLNQMDGVCKNYEQKPEDSH